MIYPSHPLRYSQSLVACLLVAHDDDVLFFTKKFISIIFLSLCFFFFFLFFAGYPRQRNDRKCRPMIFCLSSAFCVTLFQILLIWACVLASEEKLSTSPAFVFLSISSSSRPRTFYHDVHIYDERSLRCFYVVGCGGSFMILLFQRDM
jgi:hypothetical protein